MFSNMPDKIKMPKQKVTVKQQIKNLNAALAERDEQIIRLSKQLNEQNVLMARIEREGNQLVDKYNKLAGKCNSIRTLVTVND